jgi:hypothetical protein
MAGFEGTDNSPGVEINARRFRNSIAVEDANSRTAQKNSWTLNTRTFPSAKRENMRVAPRYQGNSGFFHIVFH